MKEGVVKGSKFAFVPGVIAGVTKEEYDEEYPTSAIKYELVVIFDENRHHIPYQSEAERDADYEIILQSL